MNDSKWLKLFDSLSNRCAQVAHCRFIPIWDSCAYDLMLGESFERNVDYWPTAIEGRTSIRPAGWTEYREIERLILCFIDCSSATDFTEHLSRLGKFPVYQADCEVTLIAYTR